MIHTHRIRVRYGETDQMGVVHHSVYALYFEESRTEFMRERGYTYARLEEKGVYLPVVELGVRYRQGARYDELVRFDCRVADVSRVRLRLEYRAVREPDGTVLAEGHTVHACTDRGFGLKRLPEDLAANFREIVRTGNWED
jgi:acyl-CoA thioester hydrolase